MESGVVKLTPQWLSFTNNQPQGKDLGGSSGGGGNVGSSEDRRSGSQYDNYRERYDRTGGRYNNNISNNNNYSSARGSQYGHTKHTSSTNNLGASSISQSDYGGNNSTNISHNNNNTPSNFNRSKSLTATLKKEETAQVQPQTTQLTNSITPIQQHVQTQQSPSQSLQPQPQPQPQLQQQQQQLQLTPTEMLSPISTSISQPNPPRSLYDKNFPSLSGGLLFAAIAPATSPPLPSTSYPSTSKQGGKVTSNPVSMSTSPPPNGSGTKGQPWSPRGGSPPVDGIAKSISPPISNGSGSSTINQGHGNGANTPPVLSPMPTQATPPAAILRITSPTPKAGPIPSKSVSPFAPSPSPPPLATKTPAASIIREPPKVIAKGPNTASSGGLVPTPSTELERAKSLVPTQPIVPKPLAKNLSMNSKQNSKQFVQPKGRVGPTISGGAQSVGSGMQCRVLKKSGNELEFDGSLRSESELQESATTKPNPVNPTLVKSTPRNNFFSSLRKQEEQKKKGGDSTTTLPTVGLSSSASSLAATPSSEDVTVTTSSSLPSVSSSSTVSASSTSAQPKASESTSTPSLAESLSSSSSFPSSPPSSPISIPSPSASQETFGVLFLSEEEEQRLLKQFGWSPEDEEGEEEEFYIPDEEIEALRNRLNQQKESFDQLREIRLLSLAQSVEQWQQRLFSSSAIPIKSP
jgi:hypothetical protein